MTRSSSTYRIPASDVPDQPHQLVPSDRLGELMSVTAQDRLTGKLGELQKLLFFPEGTSAEQVRFNDPLVRRRTWRHPALCFVLRLHFQVIAQRFAHAIRAALEEDACAGHFFLEVSQVDVSRNLLEVPPPVLPARIAELLPRRVVGRELANDGFSVVKRVGRPLEVLSVELDNTWRARSKSLRRS